LNEGWTTWLQRRIMNRIEGVSHDMDLDAIGGVHRLEQDVNLLDKSLTSLYLALGDGDPDESYSSVPYEKGFHLLYTLERMVGEEVFLELVTAYLQKFAYGTITSEEFKEFCISFWQKTRPDAYIKLKAFDWDSWIYDEGMPPLPEFNKTLADAAESLAAAWVDFDDGKIFNPPIANIDKWSSAQKLCFLDALLKLVQDERKEGSKNLEISTLKLFDNAYGFQRSRNAEILFRYCMLAVQSEDQDVYPIVIHFVSSQGRMKYIRPLYRAMFASLSSRDIAVDTFLKNKEFYHPIATKLIAYDLTRTTGQEKGFMDAVRKRCFSVKLTSPPVVAGIVAAAIGALVLTRPKK